MAGLYRDDRYRTMPVQDVYGAAGQDSFGAAPLQGGAPMTAGYRAPSPMPWGSPAAPAAVSTYGAAGGDQQNQFGASQGREDRPPSQMPPVRDARPMPSPPVRENRPVQTGNSYGAAPANSYGAAPPTRPDSFGAAQQYGASQGSQTQPGWGSGSANPPRQSRGGTDRYRSGGAGSAGQRGLGAPVPRENRPMGGGNKTMF